MATLNDTRRKTLMRSSVVVTTSLLSLVNWIVAPHAAAAEIQWNGGFNQSWHQVFNWDPFGSPFSIRRIPSDIDTANLLSPAGDDVFLFGNTEPINGLIVSNGIDLITNGFLLEVDNVGSATTSIAGGARLEVEPRIVGGNAFETDNLFLTGGGILDIDGGSALVQGNTTIFGNSRIRGIGGNISFGGNVSVLNSSVLRLTNGTRASFAPGTTVSAQNSSIIYLDLDHNVVDGMTIELLAGSRMEATRLNIGYDGMDPSSPGTVILDQTGGGTVVARIDVAHNLNIGSNDLSSGEGLLQVKDGFVSVGSQTIVRDTGILALNSSRIRSGYSLDVNRGSITSTNTDDPILLDPGAILYAYDDALIDIDGSQSILGGRSFEIRTGSDLKTTGDLTVGTFVGDTAILVVDGFFSSAQIGESLIIGDASGMTGVVNFRAGSDNTAKNVQVGLGGTGTLLIELGAALFSETSQLGVSTGSSGTGIVSGTGSLWAVSGTLDVGSVGTGILTISGGGRVSSSTSIIGAGPSPSAYGSVRVTGANSNWTTNGVLSLGDGPADTGLSGILTIEEGGSVNVGTALRIYANGRFVLDGGTLTTPTFDFQGGEFNWLWSSGTLHVESYPRNLVNLAGILAPGESAGGTTIMGNYTQHSDGAIEIEIGGTSAVDMYDQVNITGSAILDGDLLLALMDGFVPNHSDSFTVLNATGGISGVFDNITTGQRLATTDGLGSFLVNYGTGSLNPNQIVLSEFLVAYSADFDRDGDVDDDDLLVWQTAYGIGNGADADDDGDSDGADYLAWQRQYGSGIPPLIPQSLAIPEPATVHLSLMAAAWIASLRRLLTTEYRGPVA